MGCTFCLGFADETKEPVEQNEEKRISEIGGRGDMGDDAENDYEYVIENLIIKKAPREGSPRKRKKRKKKISLDDDDGTFKVDDDKTSKVDDDKTSKDDDDKTSKDDDDDDKTLKVDDDKTSKVDDDITSKVDDDKTSKVDDDKTSKVDDDKTSKVDTMKGGNDSESEMEEESSEVEISPTDGTTTDEEKSSIGTRKSRKKKSSFSASDQRRFECGCPKDRIEDDRSDWEPSLQCPQRSVHIQRPHFEPCFTRSSTSTVKSGKKSVRIKEESESSAENECTCKKPQKIICEKSARMSPPRKIIPCPRNRENIKSESPPKTYSRQNENCMCESSPRTIICTKQRRDQSDRPTMVSSSIPPYCMAPTLPQQARLPRDTCPIVCQKRIGDSGALQYTRNDVEFSDRRADIPPDLEDTINTLRYSKPPRQMPGLPARNQRSMSTGISASSYCPTASSGDTNALSSSHKSYPESVNKQSMRSRHPTSNRTRSDNTESASSHLENRTHLDSTNASAGTSAARSHLQNASASTGISSLRSNLQGRSLPRSHLENVSVCPGSSCLRSHSSHPGKHSSRYPESHATSSEPKSMESHVSPSGHSNKTSPPRSYNLRSENNESVHLTPASPSSLKSEKTELVSASSTLDKNEGKKSKSSLKWKIIIKQHPKKK